MDMDPGHKSPEVTSQEKALEKLLEVSPGMRGQFKFRSPFRGPFVSPKIRVGHLPGGKLIAAESIPPGSLVFLDLPKISYPNFILRDLKDFGYKLVDVRGGVVPSSWSCVCCTEAVGPIVPVWCGQCDLPLCSKCGLAGEHEKLDPICTFAKTAGTRGRRFLELGNVYLDVALTRFLMMQSGSEEFRNEVEQLITTDLRLKLIATSAGQGSIGHKFSQRTLPLAFSAAKPMAGTEVNELKDAVLKAFALLSTLGTGFYPRPDIGIYHSILGLLNQNCFPNVEVQMNGDDRRLGIWTTQLISAGDQLGLDFHQHPLLPTVYRQRFQKSKWGEGCACARCCDPTEFGTYLGSTICPKCHKGYLSPQFIRFTPDGIRMWDEEDVSCFCMDLTNQNHPCHHMCPLSSLTDQDRIVWDQMAKMGKIEGSKKLKEQVRTEFGFHGNQFLLHLIDGHKSSPQGQFLTTVKKEDLEEFDEGVTHFKERLQNFQHFFSIVRQLTPDLARHNGYMLLHEAQLEKSLGKVENQRAEFENDWEQNYICKIVPKFMSAWERILWRRSPDDLPALTAIALEFMCMRNDPGISKAKADLILQELTRRTHYAHAQDGSFENGAGILPLTQADEYRESAVEENLEGVVVAPSLKRSGAAQLLLKSVIAAAMTNSEECGKCPQVRLKPNKLKEALHSLEAKERAAHVLKPNKLKEALLCREEKERAAHGQNQLCLLPAEQATDGACALESKENDLETVSPIPVHVTTMPRPNGSTAGGRRGWNPLSHFAPIGGKKRYRHNGVDCPYVGTLNSTMIINQHPSPKSHKVIDCASYGNSIQNSDAPDLVGGFQIPRAENRPTFPKNGGRNYSVLKYLCGSPPLLNERKKCRNPLCPEGSIATSNFDGGPPTFFQNWTQPSSTFHSNFQGHPLHPMFCQPLFNFYPSSHN